MNCARCGGNFYRDWDGVLTCINCGRPAIAIVPLEAPVMRKENLAGEMSGKQCACGTPLPRLNRNGRCTRCSEKAKRQPHPVTAVQREMFAASMALSFTKVTE